MTTIVPPLLSLTMAALDATQIAQERNISAMGSVRERQRTSGLIAIR